MKDLLQIKRLLIITLIVINGNYTLDNIDGKARISDLNVKLPICKEQQSINCSKVYYKVKGFNGCYEWSIENGMNDLVSLENISKKKNKDCYKAVISTKINYDPKTVVYLTAFEKQTKQYFKVKIGFGYIAKISIHKRFDSMNVGDTVELSISAKDDHNNTFSSVEGLVFDWDYTNPTKISELVKLSNEKRDVSDVRSKAEETYYSDIVFVKGLNTGMIKVYAVLKNNGYNDQKSNDKEIIIKQRFELAPSELWIMTNTSFDYTINLIMELENSKQNISLIPLKSSEDYQNYIFTLPNTECGSNIFQRYKSQPEPCNTSILADDIRLSNINKADSQIHVVTPDSIEIGYKEISHDEVIKLTKQSVLNIDHKEFNFNTKWNLFTEKYYLISQNLKYSKNFIVFDDILIEFFLEFSASFKKENIEIVRVFKNSKFVLIKTLKKSEEYEQVNSSIINPKNQPSLLELKARKQIRIFDMIRIEKFGEDRFYLPYLNTVNQPLNIIVVGGSGDYSLKSSNTDHVYVRENVLYAKNIGLSTITAYDNLLESEHESYEGNKLVIEVTDILDSFTLDDRQETEVEIEEAEISIIGLNKHHIFTNCTEINTEIDKSYSNTIASSFKYPTTDYLSTLADQNMESKVKKYTNSISKDAYLKYAKFGICGIMTLKSTKEHLLSFNNMSIPSILSSKGNVGIINKPQVQFYKRLMQITPFASDHHTLSMLSKSSSEIFVESNIILSPGSGVIVAFDHGINPWQDDHSKFTQEINLFKMNNNIKEEASQGSYYYYFKISSESTKSITITCWKEIEYDFIVELSTYNKDFSLLKTKKKTTTSILFSCSTPSYLSMNFEDYYNYDNILAKPQNKSIRYIRQINSKSHLRVYALDKKLRLFTSFKGIYGEIASLKEFTYEDIPNELFYNRLLINFSNFINNFKIEYCIKKPLCHDLLIETVNLPFIQPAESKIFLFENNILDLMIVNGSGNFIVEVSDHNLASFEYDTNNNNRLIRLKPRNLGTVIVRIKDKNLLDSEFSSAIVKIVDIHHINIIAPNYLLVGHSIDAAVRVYDSDSELFSLEQVERMKLVIHDNDLSNSKIAILNEKIIDSISIKGINEGTQAIVVKSITNRLSNTVYITIFGKLDVFPPELLLYPGAEFTLKIIGGPENEKSLTKRFSIEDSNIASIGKTSPKVKAKLIGETKVIVKLLHVSDDNKLYSTKDEKDYFEKLKDTIFCEVSIPVQVAFPERIEIEGANNRKIYSNSTIRLLSSLKLGNRSFTYGIGDIEHSWYVDNPLLAKFSKDKEPKCKELSNDKSSNDSLSNLNNNISNEVGTFLQATNYGTVTIKLNIKITYPSIYSTHRPNTFFSKKVISIEEDVWVDITEFYNKDPNKSSLYLLPLNKVHDLKTHKTEQNVKYQLLKDTDLIKLTPNGRITTKLQNGLVNILIEKSEKYGGLVIPTVLNIYITDYHNIFAQNSHETIFLEAGKEIDLKISLQHESGILFAEGYESMDITIVESHPKIAKGEIHSKFSLLRIVAFKPGNCNIIIYDRNTRKIYDVFRVHVESNLTLPEKFILSISSSVELFKNDKVIQSYISNLGAQWISSDSSIINISKDGLINAMREGHAKITLESYSGNKTYLSTYVQVYSLNSLKIELDNLPAYITNNISNSQYKTIYKLPFKYQVSNNRYLSDNNLDEAYKAHNIDFKFETTCEKVNNSDLPTGIKSIETATDGKSCLIQVNQSKDESFSTKVIRIELNSSSNSYHGTYNKQSIIEIDYNSGKLVKESLLEFDIDNRIHIIELNKLHSNNNIVLSSPNPNLIFLLMEDSKIKVDINPTLKDSFNSYFTIKDMSLNESQEVKIVFTKTQSYDMYDILLIVVIILCFCFLFLWCVGGPSKPKKVYSFKAPSGGKSFMKAHEE